jgi:hypothetical protein
MYKEHSPQIHKRRIHAVNEFLQIRRFQDTTSEIAGLLTR